MMKRMFLVGFSLVVAMAVGPQVEGMKKSSDKNRQNDKNTSYLRALCPCTSKKKFIVTMAALVVFDYTQAGVRCESMILPQLLSMAAQLFPSKEVAAAYLNENCPEILSNGGNSVALWVSNWTPAMVTNFWNTNVLAMLGGMLEWHDGFLARWCGGNGTNATMTIPDNRGLETEFQGFSDEALVPEAQGKDLPMSPDDF